MGVDKHPWLKWGRYADARKPAANRKGGGEEETGKVRDACSALQLKGDSRLRLGKKGNTGGSRRGSGRKRSEDNRIGIIDDSHS